MILQNGKFSQCAIFILFSFLFRYIAKALRIVPKKKKKSKIKRGGGEGGCVRIGLKKLPLANLYAFLKIWVYEGVCNRQHKSGPCFINIGHKNQNCLNNKNTISIWI